MPSFVLLDTSRNVHVDPFGVSAADLGLPATPNWTITKRTLRGGRRDGVEVVELNNGALGLTLLPTRGMGIWRGLFQGDRLGWDSPVGDGPIHPSLVNLEAWGGLGWLEGFDELLARCGLETNGPPFQEGDRTYTLHGRIANLPAQFVAIHVAETPPFTISVEGHVEETRLFGPRFRLMSTVSTEPGSNRFTVRDEIRNLKDQPAGLELLYHWNLGPPYLEEGARFRAPVRTLAPRTPEAAATLERYDVYGPPEPGFVEQVYFFELHGDDPNGRTVVLLRNQAGNKGVALRFSIRQLPVFTLWKNTGSMAEGYVTGLEPGINLPNPRPFEQSRGRVAMLSPQESYVAEMVFEVLNSAGGVTHIEAEIDRLQGRGRPKVYKAPDEPFAPIA